MTATMDRRAINKMQSPDRSTISRSIAHRSVYVYVRLCVCVFLFSCMCVCMFGCGCIFLYTLLLVFLCNVRAVGDAFFMSF